MAEPSKLRANTTWSWSRDLADFNESAGWQATYYLHLAGESSIELEADGSGTHWTVSEPASNTAGYAAGLYNWVLTASDGTQQIEVDTGTIEVLAWDATGNPLLDARLYLADVEAEINNRRAGSASEYTIKDRSLKRATLSELMDLVRYWRRRVTQLEDEERRRKGLAKKGLVYAKFK